MMEDIFRLTDASILSSSTTLYLIRMPVSWIGVTKYIHSYINIIALDQISYYVLDRINKNSRIIFSLTLLFLFQVLYLLPWTLMHI